MSKNTAKDAPLEVVGLDAIKVRIIAALELGTVRRSELGRKLGGPSPLDLDDAISALVRRGLVHVEEEHVPGRRGPRPRFYSLTEYGRDQLMAIRNELGGYSYPRRER